VIDRGEGPDLFAGDAGGLFGGWLAFADAAVAAFALLKFHEACNQWQRNQHHRSTRFHVMKEESPEKAQAPSHHNEWKKSRRRQKGVRCQFWISRL
jgi:hypothetical protein